MLMQDCGIVGLFFFSSRRRHTRLQGDWSSDVCSSDLVAQAGSEVRDTETLHRIDPEVIIRRAQMAGFRLEAHSDALRNPHDTHQLRVFDAAIRGQTDQVILKFRKPLAATPTAACDAAGERRLGTRPAWL